MLDEFANDGHGATFEDGEHPLVDRARAYLCRANAEFELQAVAVPAIPDGMALRPIKPTRAMLKAGADSLQLRFNVGLLVAADECYAAMTAFAPQAAGQQEDAKSAEDDAINLRRMLCLAYSRGLAYMDDGEMQDARRHPSIDFLRDTPAEIAAKIAQRSADTLTNPCQEVILEHSGCGSNTQVDSLSVRLNPGDKVVLFKGRITQGFDRADAAITNSNAARGES